MRQASRGASLDFLHFTRQDLVIALLIIVFAFSYRLIIIVERAQAPKAVSAYDPLPEGADQSHYYDDIARYRAGEFPPPVFHFQPGMSYFMIGSSLLLNTDNLSILRLLVAALAAINIGFAMAAARLAFGRRSVAILAGVLLAIYPVSAFYDTDFVIVSQGIILITLMVLGVLWVYRKPGNWTGIFLLGLCTGIGAITRFELMAVGPVLALWLLYQRRTRRTALQLAVAALCAGLIVLPIALINRAGGSSNLTTGEGAAEVYRGNNRDSDGTYGGGQASLSTRFDYFTFLLNDIGLSPKRFVELELRKLGLFMSSSEPGNNLNFMISGYGVSRALQINPLNFEVVVVLAFLGIFAWLRTRDANAGPYVLGSIVLLLMTMLIWVEARIRTPIVALLLPLGAYGVVVGVEHILGWLRARPWSPRFVLVRLAGIAAVIVLVIAWKSAVHYAVSNLPQKVTTGALPAQAKTLDLVYDNTLKLVGYQIQEQYSPEGNIQPFRPYVVTLYWSILQPTNVRYSFSLKFWLNDKPIIAYDKFIGMVGYPALSTDQWQPNTIYVEHVGLTTLSFDTQALSSGDLLLTVYRDRDVNQVLTAANVPDSFVRLARPALLWGDGKYTTLAGNRLQVPFGEYLMLTDMQYAPTAKAGETIPVRLAWQRTGALFHESYSIGIYIFDASRNFLGSFDSVPLDGKLLTTSLPPHFKFEDVKTVTLPKQPGTYTLYVAVYSQATMQRLTVPDAADNMYLLGQVDVTP